MTVPRAAPSAAPSPEGIARAYYVIAGVYTLSASLIWGINTLFLLHAGLSLMQVFTANAIFTGSMALFEVPTGVVADVRGRRLSFLLSVSVLCAGTLAYVAIPRLGGGIVSFCLVSVLLGLGYTFYSGAVEAWLVDALRASGSAVPLDRVLARGAAVSAAAMLIGSVAGGLLGSIDLAVPYLVRALLLVIAFGVAVFTMHEVGFTPRPLVLRELPTQMASVAHESVRFGWRVQRVRLAILSGAAQAVFLEWGYHAWQPYFLGLLHSNAVWIAGAVASGVSLATIAGNAVVERATRYCGRRTTMLLWGAAIYSVTTIGVGFAPSFAVAVTLYLVGMAAVGMMGPVRQAYLHQEVPSEQRATVLSFSSLVSSGGSMGGQLGLGRLATGESLGAGYVVGGILTALAIPAVLAMRKLGGHADQIFGTAMPYDGSTKTSSAKQ